MEGINDQDCIKIVHSSSPDASYRHIQCPHVLFQFSRQFRHTESFQSRHDAHRNYTPSHDLYLSTKYFRSHLNLRLMLT
jgi:hypothetical protein